jgi:hypothetical protein
VARAQALDPQAKQDEGQKYFDELVIMEQQEMEE